MKKLKYEDIRKTSSWITGRAASKCLKKTRMAVLTFGALNISIRFSRPLVRTITTDLLYQFVEKRQKEGAKNATINRNLSLLRRMMNLARREVSQCSFLFSDAEENNVRKGFLTPAQFTKLRDAMRNI